VNLIRIGNPRDASLSLLSLADAVRAKDAGQCL
jgi:hypothetical protein